MVITQSRVSLPIPISDSQQIPEESPMFVPEPTFPIEVITRSAHDEPSTFRCSPRTALGTNYRRDLRNGDHGSSNALVSNGAWRHAPFVQLRSNQFDRKPVDYDKGTVENKRARALQPPGTFRDPERSVRSRSVALFGQVFLHHRPIHRR